MRKNYNNNDNVTIQWNLRYLASNTFKFLLASQQIISRYKVGDGLIIPCMYGN